MKLKSVFYHKSKIVYKKAWSGGNDRDTFRYISYLINKVTFLTESGIKRTRGERIHREKNEREKATEYLNE